MVVCKNWLKRFRRGDLEENERTIEEMCFLINSGMGNSQNNLREMNYWY